MLGGWRLDVVPADPAAECVYLHVLYAADATTARMPDCSVAKTGAGLTVKAGNSSHLFKAE
jgi:hypothetical protein